MAVTPREQSFWTSLWNSILFRDGLLAGYFAWGMHIASAEIVASLLTNILRSH